MELALSYLKRLYASGYFRQPHTFCDGVWFDDHPACRDAAVWDDTKHFLIENGYVLIERLPFEQTLTLHPMDQLDAWWFRLTPKGEAVMERDDR